MTTFKVVDRNRHPVSDWKHEVANGDTVLGYEEWLLHCVEADWSSGPDPDEYECFVSCAYNAEAPEGAARQFMAELKAVDDWFMLVRSMRTNQEYMVHLPAGDVEDAGEKWPDEHEGVSAMAGDDYILERHKEIRDIAIELFEQGRNPKQVREHLRNAYGYSQDEIMAAAMALMRLTVKGRGEIIVRGGTPA